MFKKCGFIVEKMKREAKSVRETVLGLFSMKVFAEESTEGGSDSDDQGSSAPTNQVNFEVLIAQARKEEKEKLYPRIKKLEEENKVLTANNNSNLLKVATLTEELNKLKSTDGEDSQLVKDLKKQIADLTQEVADAQSNVVDEKTIRAEIEAEYELKTYKAEKIAENKENILPIFLKSVDGKTKGEIDSAIQVAIDSTKEVKEQVGSTVTPPTTKPSKPPKANPSESSSSKEIDYEKIKNLDPASKEYKEFRQQVGLK